MTQNIHGIKVRPFASHEEAIKSISVYNRQGDEVKTKEVIGGVLVVFGSHILDKDGLVHPKTEGYDKLHQMLTY